MVRSKAGIENENELALKIYRRTDGALVPITTRASGNVSIPLPDLLLDDGETVHAMELKKTSKDKVTFTSDPEGDPPTDDLYQLLLFAQLYPRPVSVYLGVDFPYKQLACTRLWVEDADGVKDLAEILEEAEVLCPIPCKHTRTDNFIMYRPEGSWVSAQVGDDVEHALETIGYL